MATYGWQPDFVRRGIPGAHGWVYYNWAMERELSMFGPVYQLKSESYVRQEWRKRISALKLGVLAHTSQVAKADPQQIARQMVRPAAINWQGLPVGIE
jgi:hypothetical protein